MQHIKFPILLILVILSGATTATAQQKKKVPPKKTVHTVGLAAAVPLLKTSWGNCQKGTLPKSEVLKLLDSGLVVRDEKNMTYQVLHFDFGYEKKELSVNDTTGMPEVVSEYIAYPFQGNQLSPLWNVRLKQRIQPSEALYFDNIIVLGPNKKKYLAPPLKFVIN